MLQKQNNGLRRRKLATGKVRLFGKPEIYYQDQILKPSIRDLGVTINIATIRTRDHHAIFYILDNCQNPDGTCKLKDRKPLRCRLFPFSLEQNQLIDPGCPKTEDIMQEPGLKEKAMEVRRLLGLE